MEILDKYNALQKELFEYFGYVENWRAFPVDDARQYFWMLDGVGPGTVRFADSKKLLKDEDLGEYYENEIYTQRHLEKWVYIGAEYTMIVVDTHTDGNKFLKIFSNDKRVI